LARKLFELLLMRQLFELMLLRQLTNTLLLRHLVELLLFWCSWGGWLSSCCRVKCYTRGWLLRQRDVELLFPRAALGPAAKAVIAVLWH
jgi:hypothetical protein